MTECTTEWKEHGAPFFFYSSIIFRAFSLVEATPYNSVPAPDKPEEHILRAHL